VRDQPRRLACLAAAAPRHATGDLAADKTAQENFQRLAPSHQQRYIGWISDAKREATRGKRIEETVRLLVADKKTGLK